VGQQHQTRGKAAIHVRLSQDRDGTKTGTDQQEADCRALCKREGLTVGCDAIYRV
jgi:hypothetical protein